MAFGQIEKEDCAGLSYHKIGEGPVTSLKLPRKQLYGLVGESQLNADGTSRQALLHECNPGEAVELVRERSNPHDSNAILVRLAREKRGLGYIGREDAAILAPVIDSGAAIKARIHELTGGVEDAPSFGCVICLVEASKPFRAFRELDPEQRYYKHAPTWRVSGHEKVSKPGGSRSENARRPKPGIVLKTLLKLLK